MVAIGSGQITEFDRIGMHRIDVRRAHGTPAADQC